MTLSVVSSSHSIARRLPDLPRWVEVRDLLLSEKGEIFGLQEEPELSFVLLDSEAETVFVIGTPPATAVEAAVQGIVRDGNVIAPQEQAAWLIHVLPGWTRTRIILHSLRDPQRLPMATAGEVDFLDPSAIDRLPISSELLGELWSGAEHSLIAATLVDKQPVSFCYAGSETETLWDIAIDTLPEHRRMGYAGLCVAYFIRHMQTRGKQPVWQALEDNPASSRLAQKLGFVPVDELALFERYKTSE